MYLDNIQRRIEYIKSACEFEENNELAKLRIFLEQLEFIETMIKVLLKSGVENE